jgi:hypothetical protein
MPVVRKSLRKSRRPRKSNTKPRKSVKIAKMRKSNTKPKKSVRKSRKSRVGKCKKLVYKKVAINLKEYKEGRYLSPQQAIAVAYSQIREKYPSCKKYLTKKQ